MQNQLKTKIFLLCVLIGVGAYVGYLNSPAHHTEPMSPAPAPQIPEPHSSPVLLPTPTSKGSPTPLAKTPAPEQNPPPTQPMRVLVDPYQDDTVIAQVETKPDPDGNFTRTKVVRSNTFKYPLIRVKEGLVKNFSSGEESLQSRTAMVADHVIVTLEPEYTESDLTNLLQSIGNYQIRKTGRSSHYFLVTFEGTTVSGVDKAIQDLKRSKIVSSVEPDFIVNAH